MADPSLNGEATGAAGPEDGGIGRSRRNARAVKAPADSHFPSTGEGAVDWKAEAYEKKSRSDVLLP